MIILDWIKEFSSGYDLNIINLNSHKIFNNLKNTIVSQNEPFGGLFVCGYNELYKRARKKNIKVLLDGNGVDETFLGYKKYHLLYSNLGSLEEIKIMVKINYSQDEMRRELRTRKRILEWMVLNDIRKADQVSQIITEYYVRPHEILARVDGLR